MGTKQKYFHTLCVNMIVRKNYLRHPENIACELCHYSMVANMRHLIDSFPSHGIFRFSIVVKRPITSCFLRDGFLCVRPAASFLIDARSVLFTLSNLVGIS